MLWFSSCSLTVIIHWLSFITVDMLHVFSHYEWCKLPLESRHNLSLSLFISRVCNNFPLCYKLERIHSYPCNKVMVAFLHYNCFFLWGGGAEEKGMKIKLLTWKLDITLNSLIWTGGKKIKDSWHTLSRGYTTQLLYQIQSFECQNHVSGRMGTLKVQDFSWCAHFKLSLGILFTFT